VEIQLPEFALPKPPRAETVSAESAKDLYHARVIRILKEAREMAITQLYDKVQREIEKMCAFSREEFDRTLAFLESLRFIRRDPAKPLLVFYVPD
jgi:hypothetical protein